MPRQHVGIRRMLVGLACLLALSPCTALAEPAADKPLAEGYEQIVVQATSGEERDAFAPEEGFALQTTAGKPAYFDLRHVSDGSGGETSYVTPVRQQNPYGSCWGFGAIAAAESSLGRWRKPHRARGAGSAAAPGRQRPRAPE